jgi:integrase
MNKQRIKSDQQTLVALSSQLAALTKSLQRMGTGNIAIPMNEADGIVLTKKEIDIMPEALKRIFIANDCIVNYRITQNGYYEARIRRKDINIEASAKDFQTLRRRFLAKLMAFEANVVGEIKTVVTSKPAIEVNQKPAFVNFKDYSEKWLEIKQNTTKPSTYKEYVRMLRNDIQPVFGKRSINDFSRQLLQDYLLDIVKSGRKRTAEKQALVFKCIFDLAADDFELKSPMKNVVLPKFATKKGHALTHEEETLLVDYCIRNYGIDTCSALLVLLYFGLRKSELKTLKVIDNTWLEVTTSKQRMGYNEEIRRAPFTPMVKKMLPYINFTLAKNVNEMSLHTKMKSILPEHHLHELRYTYITRCKECGVHPEIVMLWDGHSEDKDVLASRVDRGYTDFSLDFQLKEAEKVDY